jgi:coatomer protein complex subunit epsilon
MALQCAIFLKIDRPDLAEKQIKALMNIDDDSSISILTNAAICLHAGGKRVKEAALLYKDLLDRFGPSISALNGIAATSIALGRYEEAEAKIEEAFAIKADSAETLCNQISLLSALGRTQEALQIFDTLASKYPTNSLVQSHDTLFSKQFERVSSSIVKA